MGSKIIVRITDEDISRNTAYFATHRQYVEHLFKQLGYIVTKWKYEEVGEKWSSEKLKMVKDLKHNPDGIIMMRTDSDINPLVEFHGEVGVNLQEYRHEP